MSTVLGDFLLVLGDGVEPDAFHAALRRYGWKTKPGFCERASPGFFLFGDGDVSLFDGEQIGAVGVLQLVPSGSGGSVDASAFLGAAASTFGDGRSPAPEGLAGRFAYAAWDSAAGRFAACTDHFRTVSLYFAATARGVLCATDLRLLLASGLVSAEIDPRAVYHYLNFCYVPAPFTLLKAVSKVPAGSLLEASREGSRASCYWDARYPEDLAGDDDALAHDLRARIEETVRRYRPDSTARWGAFLSGGTDSSSIAGLLSRGREDARLPTFSIGFEEAPFDEMRYVDIAAARFPLESHRKTVRADEAFDAIPRLLEGFDEPFGNSSAIPTYFCAALAQEHGVDVLLAGDGGDEIFGGNERYRKDKILGWFHSSPGIVRSAAKLGVELLNGVDTHFVNRLRNFVERGSLPNPDRFYSDDSFASDHFAELLTADFRALVQVDDSLEVLRETYARADTASELHRLMYLDLKRTIADSDIVKVGRTSKMAGVATAFPYLDAALVDFTGRLPAACKVRGLDKRFLFKKALEDVLPLEIRKKKKQGFGLPMEIWLRREKKFEELVADVVLSPRARDRGIFDPSYVSALVERHQKGAWDHSTEIFRLLMLELWQRAYLDV